MTYICSIIYHHGALCNKQLPNNKTEEDKDRFMHYKNRHAPSKQIKDREMKELTTQ
jgi:hypothetical protein